MAEAAVTFLLEHVKNLFVEHKNLSSGAKKERKQLQGELELMNAFLMEYGNREKGPVLIQIERQIREAVHEAEDTLDACLSHKANSSSRYGPDFNFDLAKKVKEVRLDLQTIFDRAMKGWSDYGPPATTPPTSDNRLKKEILGGRSSVV